MPDCPKRFNEEREGDRWELVSGKALKDWVTRIMEQTNVTRREARAVVLGKIQNADLTLRRSLTLGAIPFTEEEKHIFANGEEDHVVPLIKKYLRTPEQRQKLAEADVTIEDCLNGRIEGGTPDWVHEMFTDWNKKLGYTHFGF